MIAVVTDSATDVPPEILKKYSIEMIPVIVILGEKEYKDAIEITPDQVIDYMEKGFLPRTSQATYNNVMEEYQKLIERGFNEIIAVNVSHSLSGTYNLFSTVAKEVMKKNPAVKIEVIDSLNVSIGAGILAIKAAILKEEGKSFSEIVTEIRDKARQKIFLFYTIPSLKYLKAGGRIGKVSSLIGEKLNIKPIISCDKEGMYYTVAKARGIERGVQKMIELFKEATQGKEVEFGAVYRSGKKQATLDFQKKLTAVLETAKPKYTFLGEINASLLVYSGPELIGIGGLLR